MKSFLVIFYSCCYSFLFGQSIDLREPVRLLALGDSYTIGQSISPAGRWPVQLASRLNGLGIFAEPPVIIARTGWRTDNLANAIANEQTARGYNLVSLLIGVNNFYQGRSKEDYEVEFEELLQTALSIVDGKKDAVFVVSIPDFAYTPFGQGFNTEIISAGIDTFNAINFRITKEYDVPYIDITPISREGLDKPELVAADGLHPSAKQYGLWVEKVLEAMGKGETVKKKKLLQRDKLSLLINTALNEIHWEHRYGHGFSFQLELYSIDGKRVVAERFNERSGSLKLEPLNHGLYVIHVLVNGNYLSTYKYVAQ